VDQRARTMHLEREPSAGSFADLTLAEFGARLGSTEPVPGGGSASAVAASLAAALVEMVAGLSLDRPKYAPYRATVERALRTGQRSRRRFLELADADAEAYARYTAARRAAKSGDGADPNRAGGVAFAARSAADVPLDIVRECRDLAVEIEALSGRSNVNASSDLNVAALLVDAAARGAAANVLINLPSVDDEQYAATTTSELQRVLKEVQQLVLRVKETAGDELREPEPD
jgi:formiminotetrahydrofolate cyclodeaminase